MNAASTAAGRGTVRLAPPPPLAEPAGIASEHHTCRWRRLLAQGARLRRARASWWRSATWTRATGPPIWRAARKFGYTLLSVILISNLMAILLQALCAQARHRHRPRPRAGLPRPLLAPGLLRALGPLRDGHRRLRPRRGHRLGHRAQSAVRDPAVWGVCITAVDVLLILLLQNKGFRYLEAFVVVLDRHHRRVFCRRDRSWRSPVLAAMARGLRADAPRLSANPEMLYIAIGILGATVMPHNLYLHSSIVQTREIRHRSGGKREAIKFATIDSTVALMFALLHQRRDPDRGGGRPSTAAATRTWPKSGTRTNS